MGKMATSQLTRTAVLGLLALASCTTAQIADLAKNRDLYPGSSFVSKSPGDRTAFIAPLVDERHEDVLPASQGGFPISYDNDERWNRQPRDMVEDVLMREVAASHVFAGVQTRASDGDLVIKPTLVTFHSGMMETETGGRTLADVAIRVVVLAAAAADGTRATVLDQVYSDRQLSAVAMKPTSGYVLSSRALHLAMQRLLTGIDGSNIARSNLSN
jgi:hypothetical protein